MLNRIYILELSLYEEYSDFKNKEKKTFECIQILNQATLFLKDIKDKSDFFSSYSSINKCYSSKFFTRKTVKKHLKNNVTSFFRRYAILNAIQTEIQINFDQQTKKIIRLVKIKNKSKENELTQRIVLTKIYLELKKLSHTLTHFLKLPCNYPEYHLLCADTNDHLNYLVQESAIIFVCNWIQLNLNFVRKKNPMPNAPVISTLFIDKLHYLAALK